MSALLFLAQRATAFVLALAVAVHLGTILYASRGGLTAAEILARTHGNLWFLLFYGTCSSLRSRSTRRSVCATCCANGRRGAGARSMSRWRCFHFCCSPSGVRAVFAVVRLMIRASHKQRGYVAAMLHRLSGIALAIFLPLHFLALATALNGAKALDSFLALTRQPLVGLAEWGIVVALALHMTLGLRVLAIEFFDFREKTLAALSVCLAAVFAVGLVFVAQRGLTR